jgi:hypothetical protein
MGLSFTSVLVYHLPSVRLGIVDYYSSWRDRDVVCIHAASLMLYCLQINISLYLIERRGPVRLVFSVRWYPRPCAIYPCTVVSFDQELAQQFQPSSCHCVFLLH